MGAYGGGTFQVGIGGNEMAGLPQIVDLLSNYPNHFNNSTVKRFQVGQPGVTKLFIYDILGRRVDILADRFMSQGAYSFRWNASDLPS